MFLQQILAPERFSVPRGEFDGLLDTGFHREPRSARWIPRCGRCLVDNRVQTYVVRRSSESQDMDLGRAKAPRWGGGEVGTPVSTTASADLSFDQELLASLLTQKVRLYGIFMSRGARLSGGIEPLHHLEHMIISM